MQKVIAFLVKKVITVVMIVFSFFIKGDMTKVEMQPEEQVKAGASSATFIFENKTGKTLDLHGIQAESRLFRACSHALGGRQLPYNREL